MICPSCGADDTRVIRTTKKGYRISRRRECQECGAKFITFEMPAPSKFIVLKSRGRPNEPFDPETLYNSIKRACRKIEALSSDEQWLIMREVLQDLALEDKEDHQIRAERIGEIVAKRLAEHNTLAFARYASYFYSLERLLSKLCQETGEKRESAVSTGYEIRDR